MFESVQHVDHTLIGGIVSGALEVVSRFAIAHQIPPLNSFGLRAEQFRTAATVLCSRQGGELTCPNFLLFNQEVAPLTFITEFRAPYSPVGKIEEHFRARSAG
jgi:hypothetical protein